MMTGISNDKTSEELRSLREVRQKAAANAKVSRELAGLDARRAENEFLEYAQSTQADDEFDQLIGWPPRKNRVPRPLPMSKSPSPDRPTYRLGTRTRSQALPGDALLSRLRLVTYYVCIPVGVQPLVVAHLGYAKSG